MATPMFPPIELTVCEDCAIASTLPVAAMAEYCQVDEEKAAEQKR